MNVIHKDLTLLPPHPGTCHACAVAHEPDQPHNAQSLYYQVRFRMEFGRPPTWADAMAHCSESVQSAWRAALAERGIIVEAQP